MERIHDIDGQAHVGYHIPFTYSFLAYQEGERKFKVIHGDPRRAEGIKIVNPNGFTSNTIHNEEVPAFEGWGASIRGFEVPEETKESYRRTEERFRRWEAEAKAALRETQHGC